MLIFFLQVTEEVRKEATEFLNQMKVISERADHSFEREEKLNQEIQKLHDEVKEWKSRYAKAKTTIRSIRASSLGLQAPTAGGLFGGKDANLVDTKGLVKAVHLTKFQIAIDEVLRVARGINYAQSLDIVKSVVVATRTLTQDLDEDHSEEVLRLKSRISATANNLTTAAKNHAVGCGLSPVSLVDAAASHLTASVIELVKLVKIRPTQEGDPDEEEFINSVKAIKEEEENMFSPNGNNRFMPVGPAKNSNSEHLNGHGNSPKPNKNGHERLSNESILYSPLSSPRIPSARNGSVLLADKVGTESMNWGAPSPSSEISSGGQAQVSASFGIRAGTSDIEELRVGLHNFPMPPNRSPV
jgi:hypothetical protein